jgi:DNA repair protein RecO (recombination protein O)
MAGRERVYRTEAIILRHSDLGEADRLLTAYSLEFGKLRLVAKGVRRPGSRKAGHVEPFTRCQLLVARGRELDVITQAEAVELYPALREDLLRLGHAAYVVELMDRFSMDEGEGHRSLYRLLMNTLERLAEGADPATAVRYFELRLVDELGFRPELFRCVGCGSDIRPEDQFYSSRDGGVMCPKCGGQRPGARPITVSALKVLRHFQRNTYAVAAAPRIRPEVHAEVESVMEDYLTHLLERRLNSPAFLRRVRRLGRHEPEAPVVGREEVTSGRAHPAPAALQSIPRK